MHDQVEALAKARWRVASALTAALLACYFGFILLVAFNKPLMGALLTRGLSLGILLGASVIVASWVLTGLYVYWANRHYDPRVADLREDLEAGR